MNLPNPFKRPPTPEGLLSDATGMFDKAIALCDDAYLLANNERKAVEQEISEKQNRVLALNLIAVKATNVAKGLTKLISGGV